MRTKIATEQLTVNPRNVARAQLRIGLIDRRVLLLLLLALLAGGLAYQAPPTVNLSVGWLGDRLFLDGSERHGIGEDISAGRWFGDELTPDAPGGRSRWTRQQALITLPGLGAGGDLTLTLWVQGWPADVLGKAASQPVVDVFANDVRVGHFTPSSQWDKQVFLIPALPRSGDELRLRFVSSDTFTDTSAFKDARAKGIRVANLAVRAAEPRAYTLPALLPLALLVLVSGLLIRTLLRLQLPMTVAFVLATIVVSTLAIGLAVARVWMVALLPWLAGALALLLLALNWRWCVRWRDRLLRGFEQGAAINYGLIAAAAAWLAYIVARLIARVRPADWSVLRDSFPDSLLLGLLGAGMLVLILVYGRDGLPRICGSIVAFVGSRWGAAALLTLFLAVWLGYEASAIATLPYVGHADYADNAVVARNLLAGRGWVVDYVTQFYQLNAGITRPQETWPLLQPVWIVPFFALFGVSDWSAKIPNLVFTLLLGLMIYHAGKQLWDRRVGLTATVLVLTSYLFFRLVIYTTSDLAFTVFAFGAIWLLYRWTSDERQTTNDERRSQRAGSRFALLGSAVLTGLMMLQKPGSGILIAFGMGLWFLVQRWHAARQAKVSTRPRFAVLGAWRLIIRPVLLWGCVALAILSPFFVRNMLVFGVPFHSTESYDAWVIGYTSDWDDIYKVFTPQAQLSETDGLPEKSWILRWGFDRTLSKMWTQLRVTRDFVLPPWSDQARALASPDSDNQALLFAAGTWLALLGFIGALRTRRRLLTLLGAAFVPLLVFLITYWHTEGEPRYFVVLVPWMALLAAMALWHGYDRIAAIGDGRWAPLGLALVVAALVATMQPSWSDIDTKVRDEHVVWASDLEAYRWLREHTAPNDVVMTRLPWQLNWTSQRPALMIPNTTDQTTFLRLARYYNARYIVFDVTQRPTSQPLMDAMVKDGTLVKIFESHVYHTPISNRDLGPTFIYRLPNDYNGVATLTP